METNEQPDNSVNVEAKPAEESNSNAEQFVSRKAYEEVSSDMHKYKQKVKSANARLNELEAQFKAMEEAKLVEKEEYKTLYEKEKEARNAIEQQRLDDKRQLDRSVKLAALKSELGGVTKDSYLSNFANLDAIELNEDGSVSSEAVKAVANEFRQEHPSLLTKRVDEVNITSVAASTESITNSNKPKTLAEMDKDEKIAFLAELKSKRS